MKAQTFTMFSLVVCIALLLAVLPGGSMPTAAQEPQPPWPDKAAADPFSPPDGGLRRAPDGTWYMPAGAAPPVGPSAPVSPQATGGPDDYGYTWDDSVAPNWIDATSGTNTGLGGSTQVVGPISLPFAFKFYENTYTQLYISKYGYVGFTNVNLTRSQGRIPGPDTPNNIIAPYWVPSLVNESGYTGKVYYTSGGVAPNRYFVIEWDQIRGSYEPDENVYTFEVVLYENGDILFQYDTMTYGNGWVCGHAGIEDSEGLDGLGYGSFCQQYPSNKAIRFYRPSPSARASIRSPYQGRFTRAGETVAFQVPIRNTGELGADTYDLTTTSSWPVSLYAADGTTLLMDTDGDGTVDTGAVAQDGTVTVTVKVQTPATVDVGDDNTATLTIRSTLAPNKSKTATLQTAIPAPFAQVYRDNADGAMSLYLAQPNAQALKKTTPDEYYGYYMAVAEMPNSFAYLWTKSRSMDGIYVSEIEYTLLDRYGNTVRGVSRLTDHSGATMSTYDEAPAVAVAPNGRIGVLWYRYLWNSSTSQFNYNVWFAILDAAGNLAYGPLNLTNNNTWGKWGDYGVPRFYDPRIAATGDNRFVLAWQRSINERAGTLSDIYYAVRDASGAGVKGVTRFTNGVAGGDYYGSPGLTALSGSRALLAYYAYYASGSIAYAVLDSGGNTVKAETSTGSAGWRPDAVQLSNGNIVVAWDRWTGDKRVIEFAVLNGNTYNVVAGPTTLNNPAAVTGDADVSVAADAAGHAILTWMDYDWDHRRNLYYALVDGDGSVLTDPMIFRTSQAASPYIETSHVGYGNTSYSVARQVFLPLVFRGYKGY